MPLHALTGVRGFAAFAVMLFHFTITSHSPMAPVFARGYLGVDLFFVLSGFILQHVYRSRFAGGVTLESYRTFLRYRLARIYPVHFVTTMAKIALYLAVVIVFTRTPGDPEAYTPTAIIAALTLTHGWFDLPSPNIPSWSVSAEWFAYLFFPVLCVAYGRMGNTAKVVILVVALVAVGLWGNLHPLTRIAPEFLIGMAIYDLSRRLTLPSWSGLAALGAILCASFVPTEVLALYVALFAALIVALSFEDDILAQFLARPVFIYLGEISYSIYMVHGVVWYVTRNVTQFLHWPPSSPVVILSAIALSVLASSVIYHWIEVPARDFFRHRSRKTQLA